MSFGSRFIPSKEGKEKASATDFSRLCISTADQLVAVFGSAYRTKSWSAVLQTWKRGDSPGLETRRREDNEASFQKTKILGLDRSVVHFKLLRCCARGTIMLSYRPLRYEAMKESAHAERSPRSSLVAVTQYTIILPVVYPEPLYVWQAMSIGSCTWECIGTLLYKAFILPYLAIPTLRL